MVFQLYYSLGIFVCNWLLLTYNEFKFSYHGILGACLWVPGNVFAIFGIKYIGMSVASGLWSGLIILVSFCWGAIVFQDPIKNIWLTLFGIFMLFIGILGLALCKTGNKTVNQQQQLDQKEQFSTVFSLEELPEMTAPSSKTLQSTPESPIAQDTKTTLTPELEDYMSASEVAVNVSTPEIPVKPSAEESDAIDAASPRTKAQRLVSIVKKSKDTLIGAFCVIMVGICCGSMMVPSRYDKWTGILFALSFAVGCMIITPILFVIYFLVKREMPKMQLKQGLLPGMASGKILLRIIANNSVRSYIFNR